ncbi:hypothetical protein [Paenibacillus sp. NEAU-GSW1]|uniref:hypothetical protein n=1 Tax=Paenibacillus sp. NEAU-GSW1 TaxID=2682486 RepID=UPI001563C748|nr:hypothetical protein [Paenibacillus sp. NEAU-GSW1]
MGEWMDVWLARWFDGWLIGWLDGLTDGWINEAGSLISETYFVNASRKLLR